MTTVTATIYADSKSLLEGLGFSEGIDIYFGQAQVTKRFETSGTYAFDRAIALANEWTACVYDGDDFKVGLFVQLS